MRFRAEFTNPFKGYAIEDDDIDKVKIMYEFEGLPWSDLSKQRGSADETDVFESHTFEVENMDNGSCLTIYLADDMEWNISYKRPKLVEKSVENSKNIDPEYETYIIGQTKSDVCECLNALVENDLEFLENKIK